MSTSVVYRNHPVMSVFKSDITVMKLRMIGAYHHQKGSKLEIRDKAYAIADLISERAALISIMTELGDDFFDIIFFFDREIRTQLFELSNMTKENRLLGPPMKITLSFPRIGGYCCKYE